MARKVRSVGAGDLDGLVRGRPTRKSGQPSRDNLEAVFRQLRRRAADSLPEPCLAQHLGQGTATGVAGANEDKQASDLRPRRGIGRFPRGAIHLNDRRQLYVGSGTVVHNNLLSRWKRGRMAVRPAAGVALILRLEAVLDKPAEICAKDSPIL
jgi:hypothetical protein